MGTAKHKHHRRKLFLAVCLLLVIGYGALIFAQPFSTIRPTINSKGLTTAGRTVSLAWPAYGEAAIGATGYGVLATHGSQKALPTASIAKIITALAVLRERPLGLGQQGPAITIGPADIASYQKYVAQGGSVVPVNSGEQISEYQALEAMLLPSANNMAETLARWAFGSIPAYNDYANDYVGGLALASVKVTDPSGFLPTTVASARDLTVLGQLAMLNPVIAGIVAQPTAAIPVAGTVQNYNFLLGQDHNIGIKTGNNDQDPGAYLFAYKQPIHGSDVLIVGAVMGGPNLTTVLRDTQRLVGSTVPHFTELSLVRKGDIVGSYRSASGQTAQAVTAESFDTLAWDGHGFSSTVQLRPLPGSAPAGTRVGTVTIVNDTTHVTTQVPVVLRQSLEAASRLHRLTHPF